MKKLLGIVLTLCLVLTLAADAFAASKPEITKQPETATTSKKGAVSFSISVKGTVSSYTWYFVNPETGDKISGKSCHPTLRVLKSPTRIPRKSPCPMFLNPCTAGPFTAI